MDRNARFVHGPVDHQRNIFGPGGAEGPSVRHYVIMSLCHYGVGKHVFVSSDQRPYLVDTVRAAEGAPDGLEIDASVSGHEAAASLLSHPLEVMAALPLPLDGSLGLRPEEDYSYSDQPWNRSFLFGELRGVLALARAVAYATRTLTLPLCRRAHDMAMYYVFCMNAGVAYGVPHSASLLSLPPHQVLPPSLPQSSQVQAGAVIRGGAKL